MDHHDPPDIIARNARYGLILFAVYVVLYAGFVALSAFKPRVMSSDVAGVNLATVYGLGLILAAFVMAMLYMLLCRNIGASGDESREDRA